MTGLITDNATTAPPVHIGPAAPTPAKPSSASSDISALPTLIGACAVIAGSTALSTPISGGDWLLPLIEVVAVIWLVGLGGRLIRIPTVVTVLLQVLGAAIALTALFTTGGFGGVLPNAAAAREAGALLSGAWEQILSTAPPAPSTPELSFLIALTVGACALVVDFLIAEAKAPALVALPLLSLYSVPASIATVMLPWWTFTAPALLYLALLAFTGHPGHRFGGRAGVGVAASGAVITVLATTVAVLGAAAVTGIGTEGRLPRTNTGSSGEIGLSPFTSLHGSLDRSTPIDLLSVEGLDHEDYLRSITLQTWTPGKGWSATGIRKDSEEVNGPLPGAPQNIDGKQITITSLQFRDTNLPIFAGALAVDGLGSGWSYDASLGAVHRERPVNPERYRVTSAFPKPSAEVLNTDTATAGGVLIETGDIPPQVQQVARSITSAAPTPFGKAQAMLQWFTNPKNGFTYSLNVPVGNTGDALTDFLQQKQGYCEQYASAMAVMLRSLDIPSRVAVGFTQGTRKADGSYLITSHNAHAWVEVLFDQHGWVRFDPTPLAPGQGRAQGFDDTSATTSGAPTSSSRQSGANTAQGPEFDDGPTRETQTRSTDVAAAAAQDTGVRIPPTLWWILGFLGVCAAITVAPSFLRARRRRRRLALAAAGGPGAAGAAWAEVEDLAIDYGLPLRPTESARASANRLARSAHLDDDARGQLRTLVIAAEQEWYDTASSATGDLVAGVKVVAEGLERSAPLSARDRMLPRSMRPSFRD